MNDTNPTVPEVPVVAEEVKVPEPLITPQTPVQEAEIVPEPIVPVTSEPVVAPTLPVENTTVIDEVEVRPIRTDETGDKVYAIRGDKRYWIRNPETMAKMGFYLGREKKIPFSELLQYPEGEPIDLTVPNPEYPWNMPEVEKKAEPDKPYKIWN